MHRVKLLSCGNFVLSPKISTNDLSSENYITTDNMLPDKAGITKTDNIPFDINVTKFLKNDILLSNIRPYFKKIWLAEYTGGCSADVLVFRTNDKYDPKYIKYCLSQDIFFAYDMAGSKGSKMPRGDKNHILNFELLDYDLKTQQIIGNLLLSIDKKIELNNKINSELENIAKTLYDYWFVQFDFPAENGRPYKSSGGKMVYNPILKRDIPINWGIISLENIIKLFDKQRIPLSNNERMNMQGCYPYYGATGIMDYINKFIFDGEYILLAEDGSTSDCNGKSVVQYIWGKTWVNNHAHVIKPLNMNQINYLYFLLSDIPVIKIETGSIQKKITQDNLLAYNVLRPKENIIELFCERINPIKQTKIKIFEENKMLTQLRDFLLPMLMNGQIKITTE